MSRDTGIQDFHLESDECKVLRPPTRFHLDTLSFVDMENCHDHVDCNVCTDGSKIDGIVGAGVYILRNNEPIVEDNFHLPDSSTVYQAEMTAIREPAAILSTIMDLTHVKFFVDSQAALRNFQSDFITSKLALQTIYSLNSIPATTVTLVWTKAHAGYEGNKKADELAKAGTLAINALAIPTPKASVKASIKCHFMTLWDREWQRCPKGRQTKLYHPALNQSKSNKLI